MALTSRSRIKNFACDLEVHGHVPGELSEPGGGGMCALPRSMAAKGSPGCHVLGALVDTVQRRLGEGRIGVHKGAGEGALRVRPGRQQKLAEDTGEAHAVDGALANSGVLKVAGDLVMGQRRSAAPRSGYLHEVAQLAAAQFEGRAAELAAMAAFSTAPAGVQRDQGGDACPAYWRWLAPAWSGKTALMAQFALHPPQGVDVLAFFITARAAGRSDRTAFLAALQGQLREYLCDADVDCASQGQFLDALERAADRATAEGRQLVLVVDGLDEDTGVESASSGYSIAALLPRVPPPGLRIVVAGRPNPPVPSDVLENHPLHSARINHLLAPSPEAQALRKAAERDLHALLTGGGPGREVACLIAAANGGLSAQDLADLMGEVSAWEVEEVLGGSLGRSFQHRPALWPAPGDQPAHLFFFAHEELQQGAVRRISRAALERYRARVHAFIDAWHEACWPPDTPEYALVGYPQMLRNLADTTRLTALATDAVRHERLWETTGSDTEALAEIADAIRLHRAATDPDLQACVRLAHRRDEIRGYVASIPDDVIETWAIVGHVRRALTLTQVAHGSRRIPDLVRVLLFGGESRPQHRVTRRVGGPTAPEPRPGRQGTTGRRRCPLRRRTPSTSRRCRPHHCQARPARRRPRGRRQRGGQEWSPPTGRRARPRHRRLRPAGRSSRFRGQGAGPVGAPRASRGACPRHRRPRAAERSPEFAVRRCCRSRGR